MRNASVNVSAGLNVSAEQMSYGELRPTTGCWWLDLWSADITALGNLSPDIQTNVGSVWSGRACSVVANNSCYYRQCLAWQFRFHSTQLQIGLSRFIYFSKSQNIYVMNLQAHATVKVLQLKL